MSINIKNKNIIYSIIIIALIIAIFICSVTVIPSSAKGLKFTLGSISDTILDPGLHFKIPFAQSIEVITIRPLQLNYYIEVGDGGAITKDNQTIGAKIIAFYKYKANDIVNMWQDFGEEKIKSLVSNSIIEGFKVVIGRYTIFELPTSQDTIVKDSFDVIRERLLNYPVELTDLKITNYDWSSEFDKQIQETMRKAQEVKQKEQELLITELDAQKKVKQAEADKLATIAIAEGDKQSALLRADAKKVEGEAIRVYNEAISRNMQLELELRRLAIEEKRVEKWNGAYVPNNNYMPIPYNYGVVQGQARP